MPVSQFPFFVWLIEKAFGSWNKFLLACGIKPIYVTHTPVEHVSAYLKICKENNKVLGFHEYEVLTGRPSTRLKRLFNKGKPFAHLKEELKDVALNSNLWESFLNKFVD